MTQIDPNHLKPVRLICETEEDSKLAQDFIKRFNMLGIKTLLIKDAKDLEKSSDFNYTVFHNGNESYTCSIIERCSEIGHAINMIDFK